MGSGIRAVLDWFQRRRRRRLWRYVSPRRRHVGILLLALLVTVTYSYWLLTNPRRVRRIAQRYLSHVTGAKVKVEQAQFALFGPIRLKNVRVFLPGAKTKYPFFFGPTVTLRHDPWGLLRRGQLEATEVVCFEPEITMEHDERADREDDKPALRAPTGPVDLSRPLPLFRIVRGKWRWVQVSADPAAPGGITASPLTSLPMSMVISHEQGPWYRVLARGGDTDHAPIEGQMLFNLQTQERQVTGEVPSASGVMPILPNTYRQWLAKYDIQAGFRLQGSGGGDQEDVVRVELDNLSMRLPPQEGGVRLTNVRGEIEFRKDRVRVQNVTGRAALARNVEFELSGTYLGYEADSDFSVTLKVRKFAFPSRLQAKGVLGSTIRWLEKRYGLDGDITLEMNYARTKGKYTLSGSAVPRTEPTKLHGNYELFPYPLAGLTGRITFTLEQATIENLHGAHGRGEFTIRGTAAMDKNVYDITVHAEPAELDDDLRKALPKPFERVWQMVQPTGLLAATVRVYRLREDDDERVDVELIMTGKAGMTYRAFPYPLENIHGQVLVKGDTIRLNEIVGFRGKTRVRVHGAIHHVDTDRQTVDVVVEATNVPLDDTLRQALGADARRALDSLHAVGSAESISVQLHQKPGGELTYHARAWPKGIRIRPDDFPYELTGVSSQLAIAGGLASIRDLRGRHGQAEIAVGGTVQFGAKPMHLALTVTGTGVAFDKDLYAALDPEVRAAWRQWAPIGRADVYLTLQSPGAGPKGETDYKLVIKPKGMGARPGQFPLPLANIQGQAIRLTPGRIDLEKLTFGRGKATASLSGSIRRRDDGRQDVKLTLDARRLAVDAELIRALPGALGELLGESIMGSTCDLTFRKLQFVTGGAGGSTTRAASGPAGPLGSPEAQFEVDVSLDRAVFGGRQFAPLSARVVKAAKSPVIAVRDIAGRIYGGQVSGFGRIRLGETPEYGLSLYLEDVHIGAMMNAGVTDPRKRLDIQGLLTGDIKVTGRVGQPKTRRGVGSFRIRRAKISQLPVFPGEMQVLALALPGNTAFSDAIVQYRILAGKLVFQEIYLQGPTLAMVGSGSMDLNTRRLNLTFLTGKPGKLPRIENMLSLADQVLRFLAKELVQIHVTGTLTKPTMRTVPLRSLEEAVQRLLNPDRQDR